MNNRIRKEERYVLDIIETTSGCPLMMLKRNSARNATQKWHFTEVIIFFFH